MDPSCASTKTNSLHNNGFPGKKNIEEHKRRCNELRGRYARNRKYTPLAQNEGKEPPLGRDVRGKRHGHGTEPGASVRLSLIGTPPPAPAPSVRDPEGWGARGPPSWGAPGGCMPPGEAPLGRPGGGVGTSSQGKVKSSGGRHSGGRKCKKKGLDGCPPPMFARRGGGPDGPASGAGPGRPYHT